MNKVVGPDADIMAQDFSACVHWPELVPCPLNPMVGKCGDAHGLNFLTESKPLLYVIIKHIFYVALSLFCLWWNG